MKRPVMKLPVKLLSIIAAAWLAAPAAMAGNDVIKCTDPQGRVTLTDQPCDSGATATRLVQDSSAPAADAVPAPQRHVLPAADLPRPAPQYGGLYQVSEHPARPLARDVATLKAARRALMLMDSRPTLAGLQ